MRCAWIAAALSVAHALSRAAVEEAATQIASKKFNGSDEVRRVAQPYVDNHVSNEDTSRAADMLHAALAAFCKTGEHVYTQLAIELLEKDSSLLYRRVLALDAQAMDALVGCGHDLTTFIYALGNMPRSVIVQFCPLAPRVLRDLLDAGRMHTAEKWVRATQGKAATAALVVRQAQTNREHIHWLSQMADCDKMSKVVAYEFLGKWVELLPMKELLERCNPLRMVYGYFSPHVNRNEKQERQKYYSFLSQSLPIVLPDLAEAVASHTGSFTAKYYVSELVHLGHNGFETTADGAIRGLFMTGRSSTACTIVKALMDAQMTTKLGESAFKTFGRDSSLLLAYGNDKSTVGEVLVSLALDCGVAPDKYHYCSWYPLYAMLVVHASALRQAQAHSFISATERRSMAMCAARVKHATRAELTLYDDGIIPCECIAKDFETGKVTSIRTLLDAVRLVQPSCVRDAAGAMSRLTPAQQQQLRDALNYMDDVSVQRPRVDGIDEIVDAWFRKQKQAVRGHVAHLL